MYSKSFSGLSHKLDGLQRELSGQGKPQRLEKLGKKFEPYVERAAKNDFGDNSLSGWSRPSKAHPNWKPVEVIGYSEKATSVEQGVFLMPAARNARKQFGLGPMRVMQSGRNSYSAGDRRSSGWRVRKKDGALVQKMRKVKQNVGATRGRQTWDDALALMQDNAARHIHSVVVEDSIKHYF